MVQLMYFRDIGAGSFNQIQFGGTAPAPVTTSEGWTVGVVPSGNFAQFQRNTKVSAATFSTTEQPPDSGPNNTLGDGFRSENGLNGWFAAGDWTISLSVTAASGAGASGRAVIRLWKSANLNGTAAIEMTNGAQEGSTVTNLVVAGAQVTSVTFALPEFGLVEEYLFCSVAWRITGAGDNSADDVVWRESPSSAISAPDFSVATTTQYPIVLAGHGLLVTKGDYVRRMAQRFAMQLSTDPQHGLRLGEFSTVIPSWEGGLGYEDFDKDNPSRYEAGLGIDVHSANGKAQAGYELQTSFASSQDGFTCMQAYDGRLFAGSKSGRVYEFNGSTWTLSNDLNKLSGIAFLKVYKGEGTGGLFVGNHNDGEITRLNNTTWTEPYMTLAQGEARDIGPAWHGYTYSYFIGADASPYTYHYDVVMEKGRFWGWDVADNAGYSLGVGNDEDGATDTDLLGDKFLFGQLVEKDLYMVTADSDANKTHVYKLPYPEGEVHDISGEAEVQSGVDAAHVAAAIVYTIASNNATCYEINGNTVYLGCAERGEVYSFELGGTEEPKLVASGLTEEDDSINGIAFWQGACWVSGRSDDKLIISRIDPETGAVSTPVYGGIVSNSSNSVRALATYKGKLYVSTEKTGDARIYRVDSDLREASAVTIKVPKITFETPVIITRVRVEHSALSSGDTIALYIAENGSKDYRLLGTNGTRRSASTSYPVSIIGNVNSVSVKIEINANSASESPRVGQLTVVARPIGEVTREWPIAIHAYGNAAHTERRKDGTTEPRSGQAIIDSMWAVMEEGRVQRFRDVDNQVYEVTVEDWEDYPEAELGHVAGLRWTARFRLREV